MLVADWFVSVSPTPIAHRSHRAGKAAYLEILFAQQSALRADLDLIEAWRRHRLAQVMIYKALGGGWR